MSNYLNIIQFDDTNSLGYSVTIFFSGCSHKCEGCQNPSTWNHDEGKPFNKNVQQQIINHVKNNEQFYDAIVLTGGDPLYEYNIENTIDFIKKIKSTFKNIDIWIYTGFDFNIIKEKYEYILNYIDYIKCGTYKQELKTRNNIQYGIKLATRNQHIYKKGVDF